MGGPQPKSHVYPPGWLAWTIWSAGAAFYLLGFFQRVAPAVMTTELMRDFAIGAAGLGNLSGLYFYSYVAMQVPTGIMADAWGPRRLLTAGALAFALGAFLFGGAADLFWAGAGRLLVGASSAVAFVALLKLASHWFKPGHFGLASGLALLVGVMGALSAGVPLRLLVDAFGWRAVTVATGGLTLALAAGIWALVSDDPRQRGFRSHAPEAGAEANPVGRSLRDSAGLLRRRNVLMLFLAPGGVVGPVLSFAGLWGVPFLRAGFGLSPAEGAGMCSLLLVSWAVGGPLAGWLSDLWRRRKPLYLGGCLLATLGWAAVILAPGLSLAALAALMALIGLASGGMIVGFAFGKESAPPGQAGTVSGLVNMGVMLGPTILQPAMGWVLDAMWTGQTLEGVRVYGLEAYRAAFMLMPAWGAAACALLALTRETYCRQAQS